MLPADRAGLVAIISPDLGGGVLASPTGVTDPAVVRGLTRQRVTTSGSTSV